MLSLAGPDASKVGVDFSVTLTICSSPDTGLSAHCAPQVGGAMKRPTRSVATSSVD